MFRRNIRCGYLLVALLLLAGFANAQPTVVVRPQGGYGYFHSGVSENNGGVYHAGLRILLNAGDARRFGLELTHFGVKDGDEFTSIGILLEERMWNWFNRSIGTVGYFGYGADSDNLVGLMTNLGWEPNWEKLIKPFVTYRSDVIFYDKITTVNSLSAGITIGF